MYDEVLRILEYIQAHASVQDENGVIHDANIIWGTSEKPQLGGAIELVMVATGFEDEARAGVMRQIIPPARKIEPAQPEQPEPSGLEPIKPGAPSRVAPRQPEQVVLGARSTRYSDIDRLLAKPAYRSRNAQFVVQTPGGRKEVLREVGAEEQAQREEPQAGSLFD